MEKLIDDMCKVLLTQLFDSMLKFDRENRGQRTTPPEKGSNEEKAAQNHLIERASTKSVTQPGNKRRFPEMLKDSKFDGCDTCYRVFQHIDKVKEIQVACFECRHIFDTFNNIHPPLKGTYDIEITQKTKECRLCDMKLALTRISDYKCFDCNYRFDSCDDDDTEY